MCFEVPALAPPGGPNHKSGSNDDDANDDDIGIMDIDDSDRKNGKKISELPTLNESLRDLLDGIQALINLHWKVKKMSEESSDILNFEEGKNDYDWLMTPPDTPLFAFLDDETTPLDPVKADVTEGSTKLAEAIGDDSDAVVCATGFRHSWDLLAPWKSIRTKQRCSDINDSVMLFTTSKLFMLLLCLHLVEASSQDHLQDLTPEEVEELQNELKLEFYRRWCYFSTTKLYYDQ